MVYWTVQARGVGVGVGVGVVHHQNSTVIGFLLHHCKPAFAVKTTEDASNRF